jgi:F-type H+-transporting ATPase subunit epsilon
MAVAKDFFPIEILTPDAHVFSGAVTMAVLPGSEGEFGILSKHIPIVAELSRGDVKLYNGDVLEQTFAITGGFAHVTPERCMVMADGMGAKV